MLNSHISDPSTGNKAHVHTPAFDEINPPHGLTVYSEPRRLFDGAIRFFTNSTQGIDMNINGSIAGGTPVKIHNGIDSVEWTATNDQGTGFTFNSTTHAYNAIATIVDYNIIDAGETVTINGTNITNTTLTAGGTDWTAATSNAATATSLASAIDGVTGVSASATGAVVTVVADAGSDITTFTTSGTASELTATGQSIDGTATLNKDKALFTAGSAIADISVYVALSMWIYITGWPVAPIGEEDFRVRAWNGANKLGNRVDISTYIKTGSFNIWQEVIIPLSDLGLTNETVDSILIESRTKGATGGPPNVYFDRIEWDQTTGAALGPTTYSIEPIKDTTSYISALQIIMADAYTGTVTNGTMPSVPYDSFLAVPLLTAGIVIQSKRRGVIVFGANIKRLADLLQLPNVSIVNAASDGTNTWFTLNIEFEPHPIVMLPSYADNITITINDDLSGLLLFRMSARIFEENRQD